MERTSFLDGHFPNPGLCFLGSQIVRIREEWVRARITVETASLWDVWLGRYRIFKINFDSSVRHLGNTQTGISPEPGVVGDWGFHLWRWVARGHPIAGPKFLKNSFRLFQVPRHPRPSRREGVQARALWGNGNRRYRGPPKSPDIFQELWCGTTGTPVGRGRPC